ncbi:kinase-like domain-containing protein [Infundibulicybe gibba]|nr:kinase-like domain-containing protein [Infundibulicybe gibba]
MAAISVPQKQNDSLGKPSTQRKTRQELNDRRYPKIINKNEIIWRDRYNFFLERGWELRPRYRPDWKPSWAGTSTNPVDCEDSISNIISIILDAKRVTDGLIVCLKRVTCRSKEVQIGNFLSSPELGGYPDNHCVPILDSFQDPLSPEFEYIVMPFLRPFDDPDFWVVGEIIDFIGQMLEGLAFMHLHRVYHGDLNGSNIMMDARPIYPDGWHPVMRYASVDGASVLKPLARIDHPVRYYIIDYDCSIMLLPNESHFISDLDGQDKEIPEFSPKKPLDVFKLDVFALGNIFLKNFHQKYLGLGFLVEFINYMMTRDPTNRPTAQEAFRRWQNVKPTINPSMMHWRLRKPDESIGERVALDTYAMAHHGIQSVKRLFQAQVFHVDHH